MTENSLITEMSWTEIDEACQERPVAILPVGSTQAHGPHLPVSTDTIVATEVSLRAVAKLREKRISALVLPPVPYSLSAMSAAFAGSISLSPETFIALLKEICLATAKRFQAVALVNLPTEPRHIDCVKKAFEEVKKAGISICWADLTKKRWIEMLGETFAEGDYAGAFESSVMMAASPKHVRDAVRRSLPPMDGLAGAMKKGAKTFEEAGGEDAYFGDPTAATAEDGEIHLEALTEIVVVTIMELLASKA
jgi:creatinine amidohydrolase